MKKLICLLGVALISHVQAGSLHMSFLAKTNIPGMTIAGKTEKPIQISKSKFQVDIKSIKTGMDVRDNHMYSEVFKNKNIQIEVLNFDECLKIKKCQANLKISMAGKNHQVLVPLENGNTKFEVNLNDFAIAAPEKIGVKVNERIEVSVEISDL